MTSLSSLENFNFPLNLIVKLKNEGKIDNKNALTANKRFGANVWTVQRDANGRTRKENE